MTAETIEKFCREVTTRQLERKAFVETATRASFMSRGEAMILAEQKYPFPELESTGELPEIAEALRIPIPQMRGEVSADGLTDEAF